MLEIRVLDVDIQKFFETIDHELMMKAVEHHKAEKWMMLYISRWLKAPVQHKDGKIEETTRGTPQGGVISPVLANLYLHYTFDRWMERSFPGVEFERYADDIIIHCATKEQSEQIEQALAKRLEECSLKLHPEKTKIVYCRDGERSGRYPTKKFTFLGYTFQPRSAQNRWTRKTFTRFLPAVSAMAMKKFRANIKNRNIFRMYHLGIDELAKQVNPLIRGWYGYFSHCYKSALDRMTDWLDMAIVRWLRTKFSLQWRDAYSLLQKLVKANPERFAHWRFRLPGRAV
jgi:RNA-directed DNA polymerase